MKPANFAPVYACLYPQLAEISRQHGYALAAHGSMARDFDLVCIPWVEKPSAPDDVVAAMCRRFAIDTVGVPEIREHGRLIYTISIQFGECFIDLSFMPTRQAKVYYPPQPKEKVADLQIKLSIPGRHNSEEKHRISADQWQRIGLILNEPPLTEG